MKIISKYKDFYDFKVSKYGVDEKLIFDRRESIEVDKYTLTPVGKIENPKDDEAFHSILYVGNKIVHIFGTKNKIYTHFDLMNDKELDKLSYGYDSNALTFNDGRTIKIISEFISHDQGLREILSIKRKDNPLEKIKKFFHTSYITRDSHFEKKEWSDFEDKPILLIQRVHEKNKVIDRRTNSRVISETVYVNQPLNKIGLYLDADWMWQSLVEFLSEKRSEMENSPEMTNEAKIQSKGFDKKTSFRPKMKRK